MGATITSIIGLQNLTNLRDFRADYNSLTSIDLSGMSSLTFVDISDCDLPGTSTNSLRSVNLSGCTSIENLRLDDSDFSGGFPNLTGLNSLEFFDMDQCNISGDINISQLSSLAGFDLSGNSGITSVTLPEVFMDSINVADTALTQTSINNILRVADNGGAENGYLGAYGETVAAPSGSGVAAVYSLQNKGWYVETNFPPSTELSLASQPTFGTICADTNFSTYYITSSATLSQNTVLYTDRYLYLTASNAWYSDGSVRFEVTNGVIQAPVGCA